jgi:hypothetical protein
MIFVYLASRFSIWGTILIEITPMLCAGYHYGLAVLPKVSCAESSVPNAPLLSDD